MPLSPEGIAMCQTGICYGSVQKTTYYPALSDIRPHLGHRTQDDAARMMRQIRLPVQYAGDGSGQ